MAAPEFIASPESTLGMLQRGRGEGYRRALAAPKAEACADLMTCITIDPRIDWQVEDRAGYYASIANEIGLPLDALARFLRAEDEKNEEARARLSLDTLTELAKRRHENAFELVCDYVRWGQCWDQTLWEADVLIRENSIEPLVDAIEARFPTEEAMDEAGGECIGLQALSPYSARIKKSAEKSAALWQPSVRNDDEIAAMSLEQLLERADRSNSWKLGEAMERIAAPSDVEFLLSRVSLEKPFAGYVALAGLAKLAPPSILPRLVELWLSIPWERPYPIPGWNLLRRGVLKTLVSLPSQVALPLARGWIFDGDGQKDSLAERILEKHATTEDVPLLRRGLRRMFADEDAEYECWLIHGFNRFPGMGVVDELIEIFHRFRFSRGRRYAVEAIQITSLDYFRDHLALECLWDCESGTRESGAEFVSVEAGEAGGRLLRLAEDPHEDEDVRVKARSRLGS